MLLKYSEILYYLLLPILNKCCILLLLLSCFSHFWSLSPTKKKKKPLSQVYHCILSNCETCQLNLETEDNWIVIQLKLLAFLPVWLVLKPY
jgi:hypothetical protein